jgi:YHS domain-containing protein
VKTTTYFCLIKTIIIRLIKLKIHKMVLKQGLMATFFLLFFAACTVNAQNVLTSKSKIAVSGYDVVSYFDNSPTKGKTDITANYDGAVYQFSTTVNRDKFVLNPTKYTPQYGGWCAYGWSQGYPAKIDPESWTIVEGKLYLNYNKEVKTMWDKDQKGFIDKANINWAKKIKK